MRLACDGRNVLAKLSRKIRLFARERRQRPSERLAREDDRVPGQGRRRARRAPRPSEDGEPSGAGSSGGVLHLDHNRVRSYRSDASIAARTRAMPNGSQERDAGRPTHNSMGRAGPAEAKPIRRRRRRRHPRPARLPFPSHARAPVPGSPRAPCRAPSGSRDP